MSVDFKWINSNVVFVDQETPIQAAVEIMVKQEISSVLITHHDKEIVGIITERDIVRKFTLLTLADKLTRNVSTIMSRPVSFVTLEHLNEQIIKLHTERRMRHFPVLAKKEPLKENLVGIVSLSDFLKQYIDVSNKNAPPPTQRIPLGILARPDIAKKYVDLFGQLGFACFVIDDFHKFYRTSANDQPHILFDWDGYAPDQLRELIAAVRRYRGHSIFATSSPQLVSAFRPHLADDRQSIAIKPIDISYCTWLLTHKWLEKS